MINSSSGDFITTNNKDMTIYKKGLVNEREGGGYLWGGGLEGVMLLSMELIMILTFNLPC